MSGDQEFSERLCHQFAERDAVDCRNALIEATAQDPTDEMLSAEATVALPVLWFELADRLNVTDKQAADLVERIARKQDRATLYAISRYGLYMP